MIRATEELSRVFSGSRKADYIVVNALVAAVLRFGDATDADVLLDYFLSEPTSEHRAKVLDAVAKFGNETHARRLFENYVTKNNADDPEFCSEVFFALGYLGYEPVKEFLLREVQKTNWMNSDAVVGLLHFDCRDCEDKIRKAVEATFGKSLFNEFVPALACRLPEREDILPELYRYGSTAVSSDCNAGIVLAFSLCGAAGEKYFRQILWDNRWEIGSPSTGTIWWTYRGLLNLDISLSELYGEIKAGENVSERETAYRLYVLKELLDCRLEDRRQQSRLYPFRFIQPQRESFAAIYQNLFAWENPNRQDNIVSFASRHGTHIESEFRLLESRMEICLTDEIAASYYQKIDG